MSVADVQGAITKANALFLQYLQLAPDAHVTLAEGATFTVKAFFVPRGQSQVTAGNDQERSYVMVHHAAWLAGAAREPRKGDRMLIRGRKYAIEEALLQGGVDPPIAWICWVRG